MSVSSKSLRTALAGLGAAAAAQAFAGAAIAQEALGQFPLCEPSAAVIRPCPESGDPCLVVGDNEVSDRLFFFPIRKGAVVATQQDTLALPGGGSGEVADIEALAPIAPDQVLVWGSHGRNSQCKAKDKRRRFSSLTFADGRPTAARTIASAPIDCGPLLAAVTDPRKGAVCEAISRAEQAAQQIALRSDSDAAAEQQAKADCNRTAAFNAEGAMVVPGPAGPETWIGLRAPLLAADPGGAARGNLAILLRLKDRSAFNADRIALLDLDGRGVRDLAFADGEVWVIAGPSEDRDEAFQLRHFARDALAGTGTIAAQRVRDLPSSAEGMAILDRRAYVVIDGDRGDGKGPCATSAALTVVDLP